MPAPVKYTCPDIDRVIKRIRSAQKAAWEMCKRTEKGTDENDAFKDIESELDGLESDLEGLRESNTSLRKWANFMEDEVFRLESEIAQQQIPL